MKLTKARLKQIVKEEIGAAVREGDVIDMSRRRATRAEDAEEAAYVAIANAVGDLVQNALEEGALSPEAIRDAIGEILDEELGPADTGS